MRLKRQPYARRDIRRLVVERREQWASVELCDMRVLRPQIKHRAERAVEQQRRPIGIRRERLLGCHEAGDDARAFSPASVGMPLGDVAWASPHQGPRLPGVAPSGMIGLCHRLIAFLAPQCGGTEERAEAPAVHAARIVPEARRGRVVTPSAVS